MAWNLDAIEQTQLWRQHRVDGVKRLKFDSTQEGTILHVPLKTPVPPLILNVAWDKPPMTCGDAGQ